MPLKVHTHIIYTCTYIRGLSKTFVQYVYKNFILQILGYFNVVPFKILPIRHNTLVPPPFPLLEAPLNSSLLKPFSADVISLLIVVTSPICRPRSTNLHLGNKKKSQGAKSGE